MKKFFKKKKKENEKIIFLEIQEPLDSENEIDLSSSGIQKIKEIESSVKKRIIEQDKDELIRNAKEKNLSENEEFRRGEPVEVPIGEFVNLNAKLKKPTEVHWEDQEKKPQNLFVREISPREFHIVNLNDPSAYLSIKISENGISQVLDALGKEYFSIDDGLKEGLKIHDGVSVILNETEEEKTTYSLKVVPIKKALLVSKFQDTEFAKDAEIVKLYDDFIRGERVEIKKDDRFPIGIQKGETMNIKSHDKEFQLMAMDKYFSLIEKKYPNKQILIFRKQSQLKKDHFDLVFYYRDKENKWKEGKGKYQINIKKGEANIFEKIPNDMSIDFDYNKNLKSYIENKNKSPKPLIIQKEMNALAQLNRLKHEKKEIESPIEITKRDENLLNRLTEGREKEYEPIANEKKEQFQNYKPIKINPKEYLELSSKNLKKREVIQTEDGPPIEIGDEFAWMIGKTPIGIGFLKKTHNQEVLNIEDPKKRNEKIFIGFIKGSGFIHQYWCHIKNKEKIKSFYSPFQLLSEGPQKEIFSANIPKSHHLVIDYNEKTKKYNIKNAGEEAIIIQKKNTAQPNK